MESNNQNQEKESRNNNQKNDSNCKMSLFDRIIKRLFVDSQIFNSVNIVKSSRFSFLKTFTLALVFATIFRAFAFEPFHIPSSSMKPNLLVGDYIFVSKFSYGYSHFSLPFSPKIFKNRIFFKAPKRGDIVVFRLPRKPEISYVKRLIGLPGDKVRVKNSIIYINDIPFEKYENGTFNDDIENSSQKIFAEIVHDKTNAEGRSFDVIEQRLSPQDNTENFNVPAGHYFFMGDNRDNSEDSRFEFEVGFVPEENLIGKAQFVFFSSNKPIWQFWNLYKSIRYKRIFSFIE
jgi:signal peptidase I